MRRITLLGGILLACGVAGADDVGMGLNRSPASVYQQAARGGGYNVLPPFSHSGGPTRPLAGARGHTAAEMWKVMGQMRDDPTYHEQFHSLVQQSVKQANNSGSQLLSANR